MRRMGGWLGTKAGNASTRSMSALEEPQALQDAMASAALIMNDEVERAEEELGHGTSPFHKLGLATTVFLRATLGFEKEVMEQAASKLADAEESALEHQRRAQRDPSTSHQSVIYPVGSEYALCHAETQLMSAVVGVLNESLTESLRGFYRLRKAFNTLYEINEAQKRYVEAHRKKAQRTQTDSTGVRPPDSTKTEDDEDADLEFVDAQDASTDPRVSIEYQGHLAPPDMNYLRLENEVDKKLKGNVSAGLEPQGFDADSISAAKAAEDERDFRTITSDPIDLFIHTGTGLCYGLLQLMLSMVPPAFTKLLSIFSFRGDRETGLQMLWSATKFKDSINGAMAGLITLGFHNTAISFCDILSKDAMPKARLRVLLAEMRKQYPESKLWLMEEARMSSGDKNLEQTVELINNGPKSSLKQVEALGLFEKSLNLMYLHRYQDCADSFIQCVGLNNWSHALYYYIAGACHVELYRQLKGSDADKAKLHAAKAEKHLREVPTHTGKKRFMARQLPFDVFVNRKIAKWESRAKSRSCSFVDAVGVSPIVEMAYFWSGFGRMRTELIEKSMERLEWCEAQPAWKDEPMDEHAVLGVLKAVCQRFDGDVTRAKGTLNSDVISHNLPQFKACEHADAWPLPVAHYEKAVCYWHEAGGEDGDRETLKKCSAELAKVERWEGFDLDPRVGLKITTARQTLTRFGISGP